MLSYYGMQTEDKHQEEIPVFLLKIALSSSRAVHCCLFSPFSSSKDLFCGQVINLWRIFVKLPHSFIFGGAAEAEADVSTSFRRERETKKKTQHPQDCLRGLNLGFCKQNNQPIWLINRLSQ